MAAVTIQRLDATQADDFRAIRLAALQDTPEWFGSTYEAEAVRPLADFAERLTVCPVFGAYQSGLLGGMIGLKREDGPKDRHKGFVWGMYVRPTLRGQGVATDLVEALARFAGDIVEQLTLTVVKGNQAALSLFQQSGFEIYGIEPRALKSPAGYSDEILLVRFLGPNPLIGPQPGPRIDLSPGI